MRHPEILLLPVLMLADYFLTVVGAMLRERGYHKHFQEPDYELNPIWQRAIRAKTWFNPRHLLATALFTGALAWFGEASISPLAWLPEAPSTRDDLIRLLIPSLCVTYGMVIGRHLSNILMFRRIASASASAEISGLVTVAHSLSLSLSTYQYLGAAVPMTFLAALAPTPTVFGGLFGAWVLFPIHWLWGRRHRTTLARSAARAQPR